MDSSGVQWLSKDIIWVVVPRTDPVSSSVPVEAFQAWMDSYHHSTLSSSSLSLMLQRGEGTPHSAIHFCQCTLILAVLSDAWF